MPTQLNNQPKKNGGNREEDEKLLQTGEKHNDAKDNNEEITTN
jgi:hypothetical protein